MDAAARVALWWLGLLRIFCCRPVARRRGDRQFTRRRFTDFYGNAHAWCFVDRGGFVRVRFAAIARKRGYLWLNIVRSRRRIGQLAQMTKFISALEGSMDQELPQFGPAVAIEKRAARR